MLSCLRKIATTTRGKLLSRKPTFSITYFPHSFFLFLFSFLFLSFFLSSVVLSILFSNFLRVSHHSVSTFIFISFLLANSLALGIPLYLHLFLFGFLLPYFRLFSRTRSTYIYKDWRYLESRLLFKTTLFQLQMSNSLL